MIARNIVRSAFNLVKPSVVSYPRYAFSNQPPRNYTTSEFPTSTASDAVVKTYGLSRFLNKIYVSSGIAFAGALGTAYTLSTSALLMTNPLAMSVGGIVLTLGGLIGASYMQPIQANEYANGRTIYKTTNSPLRLALYGAGILGLGMGAAPLIGYANYMNPSIVPSALAITTAIFGGASLAAYSMPKDKMLSYGRILGGSLLGLIGMQLVGMLSYLFVGPNMLSSLLFTLDNYIGIALFTGFVAYDTHAAIKMYEMGQADHLGVSIQFLMNIWNIFVRVVSIFLRRDD